MTLFLTSHNLCKSFGTQVLFKDLSFSLFSGDRVGLVGPNGAGKSTLIKILAKIEDANEGYFSCKRGLKIGYVPQTSTYGDEKPEEILYRAIDKHAAQDDLEKKVLIETWLSKLGLKNPDISAKALSGGWKKRLSLAEALINGPDLLLLDEPTNHLDLDGILWLEQFLAKESQSYLLVSHDRTFLEKMTNRIIEINSVYPTGLFSVKGSYLQFVKQKNEFLLGQLQQERSLASKARRESEWLKSNPKARTTKSRSREEAAFELLDELGDIQERNKQRKTGIDFVSTERETKKLLVAKNLSKSLGDKTLFSRLDFTLSPKMRMGLMGPNGSGKTTLLRILADELTSDTGTIKRADGLQIVYFDQHRNQLPDHFTLRQALSPHGEFVNFRGQNIHVNGFCKRFLFPVEALDMPIERLSGGERARISIAHLMLKPADILLLDEPTNDLDIPTLETLEESLLDFPGAVVLITHDRALLERIGNTFLDLSNLKNTFYADYAHWETAAKAQVNQAIKPKEKEKELKVVKTKLSYTEKREFESIEGKILTLEKEIEELHALLSEDKTPQDPKKLETLCLKAAQKEKEMESLYHRWEELEKKRHGFSHFS